MPIALLTGATKTYVYIIPDQFQSFVPHKCILRVLKMFV